MTASGMAGRLGDGLLYSQCWEDVDIARAALRIRPGSTVVTIAAAGDNTLALLQDDPGRVLAVDVSPSQAALARLKIAAVRQLVDAEQIGGFVGAGRAVNRMATYESLRPALPPGARGYWDTHQSMIEDGVIHAGRFERHLAAFRRTVLPVVPGTRAVRDMLRATSLAEQQRIYRERWDSRRWRLLFRVAFSRRLLQWLGRDPAFFAQCEIRGVGDHYLWRARHALVDLPIWCNPYLTYMLSGRFGTGPRAPDYLRPTVQAFARARTARIAVLRTTLDSVLRDLPSESVDAFYLSDVFELSTLAAYETTLAEIARVGRPGARICYWNNLVTRRRPASLADRIVSHQDEAAALQERDRAFLYSALVVESVRGAGG